MQSGGLDLPITNLTNTACPLHFPFICALMFQSPSPSKCPQNNSAEKSFLPYMGLFYHLIPTFLVFAAQ